MSSDGGLEWELANHLGCASNGGQSGAVSEGCLALSAGHAFLKSPVVALHSNSIRGH